MLNSRFIRRELTSSPQQSIIFVLCVALSMVTLVSLGGFSESVDNSLLRDARALHAGDIIVHSNYDLSSPLSEAISSLRRKGIIDAARVYEFYSLVRAPDGEGSILADMKVVETGYPFYGTVALKSGRSFRDTLQKGGIIVEENLLGRLGLKVLDRVKIGNATLTILDVVIKEPDRPVNIFSLGPRIFISAEDLNELDLVKKGSRVMYKALLKVHEERDLETVAADLRKTAMKGQEHVETFKTSESRIKRFFDNLLFFMSLIGIFTLLLAGIGIQSALTSFLREREKTIAIMKALGGTGRFITSNFAVIVSVLGITGTILGLLISFSLQGFFPALFRGILPGDVVPAISWSAVLQGIALGAMVVALFTFLPLYRLEDVKPASILGREEIRSKRGLLYYSVFAAALISSTVMVVLRFGEVKTGLYFVSGTIALIIISALGAELILLFMKKAAVRSLALRQAFRGLFRPGNSTRAIIITMTASLTVISAIYLIELNLDADFIRSYPADAPNLFFLDIQPSQKDEFARTLGIKTEYYPVVRARIASINGESINLQDEQRRVGDDLTREFNLTYRDYLLSDEKIIKGKGLYMDGWEGLQVSVLDTVLKMRGLKIGDSITFNIQGVPLEARVSSIRTRTKASIQPFFYFVFPEKSLKDAPQTIFSAVRVEKERIPSLQNLIVSRFPNVSAIDMTEMVSLFSRVMGRLSVIARFFTLFGVVAGVLIVISSVLATRYARIQEAVYFKILGARSYFVLTVFALENIILGVVSSIFALIFAQVATWIVCKKVLDISFTLFAGTSLIIILSAILLATVTGLLASISVLRQRPVIFLREETKE